MVERPALVRLDSGRWRLYVCCATPESKHWWIGAVEAARSRASPTADARVGLPRRRGHRRQGPGRPPRPRRRLARLDLLPPARRPGRGGPHDDRLRDERRRARVALARHRPRRPAGRAGTRAARALTARPPRRRRRLRRAGHEGGELVRAHRARGARRRGADRARRATSPCSTRATSRSLRAPGRQARASSGRRAAPTAATSSAPSLVAAGPTSGAPRRITAP